MKTIFKQEDTSDLVASFGPRAAMIYRALFQKLGYTSDFQELVTDVDRFYRWAEENKEVRYLNPEELTALRNRQGLEE